MDMFDLITPGKRGADPAGHASGKRFAQRQIRGIPGFLEFFAGSGLVAHGLNGIFEARWANDICPKKAAVYSANLPSAHLQVGTIADISGRDLPAAPMAWASFPCQDLSLAGLSEGIHASRSGLVWEWLRVIDEMSSKPTLLVAENVVGLVSTASGAHYKALHAALVSRGYTVGAIVLDAELWTPQSRPRVFVIAVDKTIQIPPTLTSSVPCWLHTEPVRKAAMGLEEWVWWNAPVPARRRYTLDDIVDWNAPFGDIEFEARNLRLIAPRHRTLVDALPKNRRYVMPGYRRTRNGKQVLELRFDNIAGCLRTPEGGSSRQILVFSINGVLRSRLLTVRETARLMGVSDDYNIPGSYNDGYKAMGDAVAAPVAQWLATTFLQPLVMAANG